VAPRSTVHSEGFQCEYAEEHDVRDRLGEPAELAGREMKIEPQQKRGQVRNGGEDEVGSYDDRAPVARRNGRNA